MKGKYLVTTDNWFYATNGQLYRAVWGDLEILNDDVLGVKTNRNATNWFAKVGSEDNHVIIAGCQIHYSVRCEVKPNTDKIIDLKQDDGKEFERLTGIYIAE